MNGGQIVVKIGTATFIIVVKPKLQREILINVLITTHTGYLIFLFVKSSKKQAVEPIRPTAVVKQAKPTIIPKIIIPV